MTLPEVNCLFVLYISYVFLFGEVHLSGWCMLHNNCKKCKNVSLMSKRKISPKITCYKFLWIKLVP